MARLEVSQGRLRDSLVLTPARSRVGTGSHGAMIVAVAQGAECGVHSGLFSHETVKLAGIRPYNTVLASSSKQMSDDDTIFRDEMRGVAPLKRDARVTLRPKHSQPGATSFEVRRAAAVAMPEVDRNILTAEGIAPLDPWFVLNFKRPGVQNGVFRKLKQGRYESDARLDLHRMTVAVARRELFEFVEESQRLGLRTVLLIHGKGESSAERERSSILKGCADHWLRELPPVQAFHSAQPRHGGTGAVYILLQKSEEMKRRNRERFTKGRVPIEPN